MIRRRLVRLEQQATELELRQRAAELAAELRRPVDQVLTDLREAAAWLAWDHMVYPPPVWPDGRVDLEPSLRRMAAAFGQDPDAYVESCRGRMEDGGDG